jgi:hypothetical protein
MTTDLFAVASGMDRDRVAAAVPSACRRPVEAPGPCLSAAAGGVLEFPPWTPRRPSRHFVPALSVLADESYSVRFDLAVEQKGSWSPWTASATLGPDCFPPLPTATPSLRSDIDVFTASEPAERVRLRLCVAARDATLLATSAWLATLSACDLAEAGSRTERDGPGARVIVHVASRSQMETPEPIRHRICSPTCVAMALTRWDVLVEPHELAAEMFHPGLGLYGVWPAAMRAAARRGIAGYLLRFPTWDAARACLDAGLPVVASVRYAAGELTGAAVEQTSGHLVVLTGYDGGEVLVNDPAAPTRATVPRRYALEEMRRVWLERAGVGYVFFRP